MNWIPGWDSVAATSWWSGFYFWISIVCLIGLGAAEVISHRYSDRKDELAAIDEAAKDQRHDEDVARLQHDTASATERAENLERQAAELQNEAAQATARALEAQLALERFKAPRTLTQVQQDALAAALGTFAPQQYAVSVGQGAETGNLLCLLDSLLQKAGWTRIAPFGSVKVETGCGTAGVNSASGVHVRVSIDTEPFTPQKGARAAATLLAAMLNQDGIEALPAQDPINIPKPNVINLMVGTKP
jgi:hypothetical protein